MAKAKKPSAKKKSGRQNAAGVEVTSVDGLIESISEARHIKKAKLVELVFKWMASQPATVQTVVLGTVDEDMEGTYARALEMMAKDVREGKRTARIASPAMHAAKGDQYDSLEIEPIPDSQASHREPKGPPK